MKTLFCFLILLFFTCNKHEEVSSTDCGSYYDFQDTYFDKQKVYTAKVKIFIFKDSLSTKDSVLINNSILLLNQLLEITNKQFKLDTIELLDTVHWEDMPSFRKIAKKHNKKDVFNLYIYSNYQPNFPEEKQNVRGEAGGIPSKTIAIREIYLNTSTLAHEMLHCLGLRHVDQPDYTDGYNVKYGDLVCDTRAIPSMDDFVDGDCNYIGPNEPTIDTSHYECNIMTPIKPTCRKCITDGQLDRLNRVIYDSDDLKRIFGIKTDNL